MFCYFVSFNLAYEYLEKIEPGTILIKTPLDTKKEPKILRDRIPKSDYREIISAISRFTKKTKFSSMRAKSVKKGLSIGLALSIPIAAGVGMASRGLGTPHCGLRVSAGAGIGSACGAVNPKDLKKSFGDFNSYIENLNDTVLKEKGVFLVSPLVTNSFSNLFGISQSSARKISHVQWIVKTSPSDVGDPAVGCSHDGKGEEYDDDDDDDDADNGLYGTSSDDDSSDDDDDEYCSYYSDDDNGHHHYLFGRSKKRAVNCNLDDLKSPESGSSTSSEDDEIIQGVEDMEETLFSFMNFDFIRDDDRNVMRLQRSKSSISIRGDDKKSSKKKMERGKKKKKSKDDRHSYPGIIVVTPNPYKNEGDDDVAHDSDGGYGSVSRKCLETLEVEDISSGNSSDDDDVGYDDTKSFSGDYKLRVIRKWD